MSEVKVLNKDYKFIHVSESNIKIFEGKQVVQEATGSTSCEISFGTLPSGAEVPFFHSHRGDEENYIIFSGEGHFQVIDEAFDIVEGSVIRVDTNWGRNIKCTSSEPMTYICIQPKESSLGGYMMTDVDIPKRKNKK